MANATVAQARKAYDLAAWGEASHATQMAAMADLRAAIQAAETPSERAASLLTEAAQRDDREAYHMEEEASLAGRIAACRKYGNDEQAAVLDIQRRASERCAEKARDEAAALRSDAADIKRRTDFADAVVSSLSKVA